MASSVIGALRVNLGLDSAQFQKGVKRVSPQLRAMRAQFLRVSAAAAAFGTAISAAAMAGAREIDRAAKSARRLDASIGAFRALELAAGEAGVSLSGLTNDVQTMNREIANIGTSGNAGRALERLGLSAEELAGLDADEKVATIADRINALGLSAGEATAVLRDLGVRNREMALLMIQGGDAIRAARSEIEDYGLALSATDAAEIETANDRIARLGLISQYAGQQLALTLVPAFGRMAQAMTDSLREGGALRAVIDAIAGNIQRLGTYVATAATAFGVRYVGALVAARLATLSLSGALAVLRGALIRSGIGLVVVAIGEAVFQFTRLVSAAGGFGEAMGLVGDLAAELGDRIGLAFGAAGSAIGATWQRVRAAAIDAIGATLGGVVDFGNRAVGVFRGAFEAIREIWGALPRAIGDLAYQAAQSLIGGVETMLNAVVGRINTFITRLNAALARLPRWATQGETIQIGTVDPFSLDNIANPFAGAAEDAGKAAREAFARGFNTDTFDAPDTSGLDASAAAARQAAADADLATGALRRLATSPLAGLSALRKVMAGAADETDGAAAAADRLGDALDDGGGGSGGGAARAAREAGDALSETEQRAKSASQAINQSFTGAFSDILKGGKSLGEGLASVFDNLAGILFNQVGSALFSGVSMSLGGAITGAIPGFANGTNSAPGGLAWVGEQGRELVNLPKGSQVIPNHKLGGLGGGGATRLEVIPSPYFDVRVADISRGTAAPMVSGAANATRRAHGVMSNQFFERGTMA
ncbi:hypothetical protein [Marinibacterium profundimaris]|uniref:hypothetical protein n=1 Tax=Marinibacterium profundimaris TaxID=1679460 RepID=UPI000B526C0B|nr:hypothetical protein [Marinibacterium profundimaris]